nr:MAG TPA: hypothetical protein [Caudoviricetes sp.]
MRQWIRCQAFWDDFWKMKRADNQSGNSTVLGVCRKWNGCFIKTKGDYVLWSIMRLRNKH